MNYSNGFMFYDDRTKLYTVYEKPRKVKGKDYKTSRIVLETYSKAEAVERLKKVTKSCKKD